MKLKKIFTALLISVVLTILCACGENQEQTPTPSGSTPNGSTPSSSVTDSSIPSSSVTDSSTPSSSTTHSSLIDNESASSDTQNKNEGTVSSSTLQLGSNKEDTEKEESKDDLWTDNKQ